jgi:branched-chain amino acid transport system permease protein
VKRFLGLRMLPAGGLIPLLLLVCVIVHAAGNQLIEGSLTEALVYMVMVVGLSVFVSNSGIISFGHVSFALVGAYASAWQTCCPGLRGVFMPGLPQMLLDTNVPVVPAALTAALLATAVAAVAGIAITRLNAVAASIALLSLLFVVKTIYENWTSVTAGQGSLAGLPLYVGLWTALAWATGAIIVAQLYMNSAHGLRLRAIREEYAAARAVGIVVWRERMIGLVISAFVFAIGGILFGHYLGTLAVSIYWLDMTFLTLAMLVVGGMRSLTGAVVGTLAVSAVRELLRAFERGFDVLGNTLQIPQGSQEIVLALALLLTLVFRPQGIVGDYELGVSPPR